MRLPQLSLACLALLAACADTTPVGQPPDDVGQAKQALNEWLEQQPKLDVPDASAKKEIDCADVCPPSGQEGDQFCTYKRFTETAQFDEFVALQPNSATLWPGSVVRGRDAAEGLLTPLGAPLAPVTFSVSLESIAGSPVGHMDDPSLSAFREAQDAILAAGVDGATPAALDFQVTQVNSESQIAVALGAGVDWPGGGAVKASFDFSSSTKKTKILVNFTQAYYTVDVDTPAQPADFFVDGTTPDDIDPLLDDGEPPLYVQSITYGRRVIFSIESDASADQVKAALEATYSGVVDVSANVSFEHKKVLEESTIKAFVLGGSGQDATGAINGFEGLVTYIQNGGNYSKDSPGAPIAYKLAYLDNAVAKLAFTTDYAERQCFDNQADLHVSLEAIQHVSGGDPGSNVELFGSVGVRYPTAGNPVVDCSTGGATATLWNLAEGSWISIAEGQSWSPPGPLAVDLHGVPVGPDQRICVFAQFTEEDWSTNELSGDDDFGASSVVVLFSDGWDGEHTVVTHGGGDASAAARVKITLK